MSLTHSRTGTATAVAATKEVPSLARRAESRPSLARCAVVASVVLVCLACGGSASAQRTGVAKPAKLKSPGFFASSSAKQRHDVLSELPLQSLTPAASQRILGIAKSPTLYRRLPTETIECDGDMFLFLARNPEVLVGMWDLMGVTKVQVQRVDQYRLKATDGAGTSCDIDLVYGDADLHIFVAVGSYDGKLVRNPIGGSGVFILHSKSAKAADGKNVVTGTLDCFVKLDSLGVDLVARTLSGIIGRSADNNFSETARFIQQVSKQSEDNPAGMIDLAGRLPQVEKTIRNQFAGTILAVAQRAPVADPRRRAHQSVGSRPNRQASPQSRR